MHILHIYSQYQWHDEAYIVGDKEALQLMADAVNKAIFSGEGECQSCVNDGEGFDVHIRRVDDQQMLDKLAVPYTSDVAEEKDNAAIWPWILCRHEEVEIVRNKETVPESVMKLWEMLGDIPVDRDGFIEKPFNLSPVVNFPTGTDREDIWHWFEETFGVSVHSLMFPGEK